MQRNFRDSRGSFLMTRSMSTALARQLRLRSDLSLSALSLCPASASDLPAEIWHNICSYVPRASLPSLRLVCTKLANIAVTYLFAEIYVSWLPRSFSKISAIAAHPKLCCHVRILSFEQCLLKNELEDFETWQGLASTAPILSYLMIEPSQKGDGVYGTTARFLRNNMFHEHILPTDMETRKCLHQVVTTLLKEQKTLLEDPHWRLYLGDIISRLGNIHTIQIVSSMCNFGRLLDDNPIDNQLSLDNTYVLQMETFMTYPTYLFGDSDTYQHPILPLGLLAQVLAGALHTLTNLTIANIPFEFWHSDNPYGYWNNMKSAMNNATFNNLRSLKLGLGPGGDLRTGPPSHQQIAHFIGCFPSVTSLQLRFFVSHMPWYEPWREKSWVFNSDHLGWTTLWDLSDILDQTNLRHLQELEIDRFRISEGAFYSFMTRHAETLHTVSFSLSYMKSPGDHATRIPSWKRTLTKIAPLMSLKYVNLGLVNDSFTSWFLAKRIPSKEPFPLPEVTGQNYTEYCHQVSKFLESGGSVGYPAMKRHDGSVFTAI